MAVDVIRQHMNQAATVEEFPLDQVSHLHPRSKPDSSWMMAESRVPFGRSDRLFSNSTPSSGILAIALRSEFRSRIIPAPTVALVSGSIKMKLPVTRFLR